MSGSRWRWTAIAALVLGAVAVGGCGNDVPPYTKNCCVNGTLFYVCTDALSAGQCLQTPALITPGCVYQGALPCPGTSSNP